MSLVTYVLTDIRPDLGMALRETEGKNGRGAGLCGAWLPRK